MCFIRCSKGEATLSRLALPVRRKQDLNDPADAIHSLNSVAFSHPYDIRHSSSSFEYGTKKILFVERSCAKHEPIRFLTLCCVNLFGTATVQRRELVVQSSCRWTVYKNSHLFSP